MHIMFHVFLIIFFPIVLGARLAGQAANIGQPLYWRDFNGTITLDAFLASSENERYIGRALVDGGITVVEIIPGEKTFYGPMNGPKTATIGETVIEILCGGHFNAHWVPTEVSDYKAYKSHWSDKWTIGGKEFKKMDKIYYVGKYVDSQTKKEVYGKIIDNGRFCYVVPGNKKTDCRDDYEILIVNANY